MSDIIKSQMAPIPDRRVLKFVLPVHGEVDLMLSPYSRALHVGYQHGVLCLWVDCAVDVEAEVHRFHVIFTGHDLVPTWATYIGTVENDGIVSHVYQGIMRPTRPLTPL